MFNRLRLKRQWKPVEVLEHGRLYLVVAANDKERLIYTVNNLIMQISGPFVIRRTDVPWALKTTNAICTRMQDQQRGPTLVVPISIDVSGSEHRAEMDQLISERQNYATIVVASLGTIEAIGEHYKGAFNKTIEPGSILKVHPPARMAVNVT